MNYLEVAKVHNISVNCSFYPKSYQTYYFKF